MIRCLPLLCLMVVARAAYHDYELSEQSAGGYRGPPVVPVILPGGYIADTEEVAKARDLHFNAFAQAASAAKESEYEEPKYSYTEGAQQRSYTPQQQKYVAQPTYSSPQKQKYVSQPTYSAQQDYSTPRRQQDYNVPRAQYTGPVTHDDGRYNEANSVHSYKQPAYTSQPRYTGPPVVPVILPSGYIAETADVEAAKEHHFQLVAQAQAAVARAQERAKSYGYNPSYTEQEDEQQYEAPQPTYTPRYHAPTPVAPAPAPRQQYKGPPAVPVILPDGHLADTAEVAAAKINHLQQLLDAAQRSQPQQQHRYR